MNVIFLKIRFAILIFLFSLPMLKAQTINHWEMLVDASDSWNYFIGTSQAPSDWANNAFDASTWLSGPGGIGYGQGNEGTTIANTPSTYASLYIRKQFNVVDKSIISTGLLYVDFDDAFVAYLNGHEIAIDAEANRYEKITLCTLFR
jgi:hypothetical protein